MTRIIDMAPLDDNARAHHLARCLQIMTYPYMPTDQLAAVLRDESRVAITAGDLGWTVSLHGVTGQPGASLQAAVAHWIDAEAGRPAGSRIYQVVA